MLVSESAVDVAALEADVAELLGILETLPTESGGTAVNVDEAAAGLDRYAEQVGRIGLAAGQAGFLGLQDVCLLFQEILLDRRSCQRRLGDAERERLEEWPIFVIGYLSSPTDPEASEPLLDHLRDPVWSTPLPEAEIGALREVLAHGPLAVEPDALPTLESEPKWEPEREPESAPERVAEFEPARSELLEFAQIPSESSEPWSEPAQSITDSGELTPEAIELSSEDLEPVSLATTAPPSFRPEAAEPDSNSSKLVSSEIAEPITVSAFVQTQTVGSEFEFSESVSSEPAEPMTDSEWVPLETTGPELEADESVSPEPAESTAGSDLTRTEPIGPELEADESASPELVEPIAGSEWVPLETTEPELEADESASPELVEPTVGSDLARQELLDILRAEIEQIGADADEILTLASAADSPSAVRNEALAGYAEQMERLGDASASIGLLGLRQVCVGLQANLNHLATQSDPPTAEQQALLAGWMLPALAYLSALNDRSTSAMLARYLENPAWPQPLPAEEVTPLIELLVSAKLATEEEGAEARLREARPEDVSLELPTDVNPELLDGLLRELPGQAADFSAAIQRLVTGEGQLEDVKVAQRIAHTLKGAGNTVGVRGIATLTHQIEDILQALSKQGALPTRPLADTLQNAADCLESMSEALLGIGSPPTQARSVLQEILDWANRIDQTGIPAAEDLPTPPAARLEPTILTEPASSSFESSPTPEPAPTAAQTAPAPEATLRVPAHLVDNLLRLVGESIILTGQVQERVRRTITQTRTVMTQNRLFQQLTAELEQLVDIRNVSSPLSKSLQRGDFDPLELEQYNELNTLTHRLVEAATDTREVSRVIEENLATLDALLVDQGRLHRESQEAVLRTRMTPVQTLVPRLQRSVRQTCRLVDKEAELTVRGADTLIDSNVLNDMVDPLMHLLRNAVDHGIEPPDQRQRLDKPRVGRIELSFAREGNNIVIRCRDDGAGLDREAIRRTATARGLLAADAQPEAAELERLILLPGFSTRGETTQTSGRGIGMDVVYSRLLAIKGSLRIESRPGAGSLMEIRLPVTLIATHALLARIGARLCAISDRGVEQILYSGIGKIQKMGKVTLFQTGEDLYELTALEDLLDLPPDRRARTRAAPAVLLVREETGNRRAVLVQDIVDSRDLVVKNLGPYLPKLNGIVGATILGDGSVAPVLDLPELLRAPTSSQPASPVAKPVAPTVAEVPRPFALAVDDSLSARRSLAQCVQDAGFEVRTARDGLEAIAIIQGRRPDIVLADLEMPRMNGLELTAHLRANPATRDLPVIMITSRSTDKHRREAERAGVNVYLTKPFAEDELLVQVHRLLQRS